MKSKPGSSQKCADSTRKPTAEPVHSVLQLSLDLFGPDTRHGASADAGAGAVLAQIGLPVEFRHPQASREIRLGNALVAYALRRGKRRTIGFLVGVDGLVVSAPRWVTLRQVDEAVFEKASWIVAKLREMRQRAQHQEAQRIDWKDGVELVFLGQPVTLVLDPAHAFANQGAVLRDLPGSEQSAVTRTLHLALPRHATPEQIRDGAQAWLMRQAKRIFTERLDHFAPRLQVQWRRLALSSAGTRWGSARSDGSIRLHWRLVHFRQEVIDYVVAHELSHLRVMDHSPRFWETVGTVVPDYARLKGHLKDEALPRWV